jgi:group I intron endonuclease
MNYYVYETTNLINGKKYIGKRSCKCNIEKDKYIGSGTVLKAAIKKYGKENFKKEILQICENEEMAYEWEKVYIEQVKAYKNNKYYNISTGGDGFSSEDIKRLWENDTHRTNMSLKMKGRVFTEEHKMKLSMAHKGKKLSEEHKMKLSMAFKNNPNRNKCHTEEAKRKMSEIKKGKKHTEETKRKMSETRKGKRPYFCSEERSREIRYKLGKKVILLNTGQIFNTIGEAINFIGIKCKSDIVMVCKGKRRCAGKINGEPAKWMYYEDYLKTIK